MRSGYSKNKAPFILPSINKNQIQMQQLYKQQMKIIDEVRTIDEILKADKVVCINHLLFTEDLKNRLAQDLIACIRKQYRLLSYGFQFWKKNKKNSLEFVKKELIQIKPSFKEILHNSSINAIQKYESSKLQRFYRKFTHQKPDRRQINSQKQSRLNNQDDNTSNYTNIYQHTKSVNKKLSSIIVRQSQYTRQYSKINTEAIQMVEKDEIDVDQIQKMLQLNRKNLISIWLPPQTYPQFFGIIIVNKVKTSRNVFFRIKKYILFKESIKRVLFQSILQFISLKHQIRVPHLQMLMSKNNYKKYFESSGWKMKSWQGVDKINAIFSKMDNE